MNVVQLSIDDRQEVVDTLTSAFIEYPVMTYVIGRHEPHYIEHLSYLIGFYSDVRFQNSWPVLGIRQGTVLAAVALITEPGKEDADFSEQLEKVRAEMGDAAYSRMEKFEIASDENEPEGPHHFVGMLGVRPEFQGKGMGRLLLERAMEFSIQAGNKGVCLSTEDPRNVPYYESLGFKVVGEADVDTMHTWCLFKERS